MFSLYCGLVVSGLLQLAYSDITPQNLHKVNAFETSVLKIL